MKITEDVMSDIRQVFTANNLHVSFRPESMDAWDKVLNESHYIPVNYTHGFLDFQLAYNRGHGWDCEDISVVLYVNRQAIGVWPLTLSSRDGVCKLTSFSDKILSPVITADFPTAGRKKLIKSCFLVSMEIAKTRSIPVWEGEESFKDSVGMSEWGQNAMASGVKRTVQDELFVDLSKELEEIRQSFRSSYRPFINKGNKLWDAKVLTQEDEAVWKKFQSLHLEAAGRVTRSQESWDIQHKLISKGEAFLVYIEDEKGVMLGAGYFQFSRDEGLYAVAAYDRSLFDKPLGHVVQYAALVELKKRGIRWHKLGIRQNRTDIPPPTEKEFAIGFFKAGFATHFLPKYIFEVPLEN